MVSEESIYFPYVKSGIQNGMFCWLLGNVFSRGFFVRSVAYRSKRHTHSLRPIRLTFTAPIDFSARRCERIRTLDPLRAEALRDLANWHRCQSVRRDRLSGVVRIRPWTAGPLDRVAQIAEHKYCRPQARPFGLGFPRKVPVFPICPPAAL